MGIERNVLVIMLLCLMILSLIRDNFDIKSPSFLYSLVWMFLFVLHFIGLQIGMYDTRTIRPFEYVVIACSMFFIFSGNQRINFSIGLHLNSGITSKYCYQLREKVIYGLFLLSSLTFIRKDILNIRSLLTGHSFYVVRYFSNIDSLYIEDAMAKFVARPFCVALLTIVCAEYLLGKKEYYRRHLYMSIILTLQSLFFDGILISLEAAFSYFIIAFIFSMCQKKRSGGRFSINVGQNRIWKIMVGILICSTLLFVVKGSNIFRSVYNHYAPILVYLEERLENIDAGRSSNEIMEYTYGLATVSGAIRPFVGVLKNIFGVHILLFESATDFLMDNHNHAIRISTHEAFNFYTSSLAYYYKDLGVLGIFIFPALNGILCNYWYRRIYKSESIYNIIWYLFFVVGILRDIKAAYFVNTEDILGIYWLWLCIKKTHYY